LTSLTEGGRKYLCSPFVKTKEPRIEWHVTNRKPEQLLQYLEKVQYVGEQIKKSRFYLRPSKWCKQCDFLPVCLGDKKKAQETLVKVL
jgi:radical SAM protein with 4Fe4S-binding SPASM domain